MYVYKPYCYVCKNESKDFVVHPHCKKQAYINQIIVLTRYRHPWIKKLLKHGKYYGKYRAYEDIIFSNKGFFQSYISKDNSILIPIPMHLFRRWKRWYNQANKIAQCLSTILDIPVDNKLIYKKKYTKNQSHLSSDKRRENLWNSFWVQKNKSSKDVTIYLVDDVVSTGATLLEVSLVLHKNGYKNIRAVVLASD